MLKSLSRKINNRKSLIKNLTISLILYEEIKTTKAKAREVKPVAERLINIAKKEDLAARRRLLAYLFDKKAVAKVFEILVPRYKKIDSGFISIIKIGSRLGDGAPMVILKLKEGLSLPLEATKEKDKKVASKAEKKNPAKKVDSNKGLSNEKNDTAKKTS